MRLLSDETRVEIFNYLKERERGEKTQLSFFFEKATGVKFNAGCSACETDAIQLLKRIVEKKQTMQKYKWVGVENSSVIISFGGRTYHVNKSNCTDELAAEISKVSKYAHNVLMIEPVSNNAAVEMIEPVEKKILPVTTLTLQEPEQDEPKRKRGRPRQQSI